MFFNLRIVAGMCIISVFTAIVKLWIYVYFRKLSGNSQELCGNFCRQEQKKPGPEGPGPYIEGGRVTQVILPHRRQR